MYGLNFVNCHRKPERSFFYKGKQFPVCARCTGLFIGLSTMLLFVFNLISIPFWWSVVLVLPTYIDGMTQAYFNRESNNWLRLATGLIAGVGLSSLSKHIGVCIGTIILKLIS